jgi:TPR repeat protein
MPAPFLVKQNHMTRRSFTADRHIVDPRFFSQVATRDALSIICQALGRGFTRSKRKAAIWMRTAAENGHTSSCLQLAVHMYMDLPYAREVGQVEDSSGVATSAGVMEGHDVPREFLTSAVHWLRKGGHTPVAEKLDGIRREAMEGRNYCHNQGCEAGPYTRSVFSST